MNTTTILDLIAGRQAVASTARNDPREQMSKIAAEAAASHPNWPTWRPQTLTTISKNK